MMAEQAYVSLLGNYYDGKDGLIREYFFSGYTYIEIVKLLGDRHNINISLRQLNRVLRNWGLRRHSTGQVQQAAHRAVERELNGSGSNLGYRSMTRRLASSHGISVPRERVRSMLRDMDPEGVNARRNHVLNRRAYINKGPNYLVHLDGYDKLKKFGFPIHAAIDGYSRRLLWLEAVRSNNNPRVIGTLFLSFLRDIEAVPRCVRMDAGTENTLVEDIQKAFRYDHTDTMAGEKSVIKGSSHTNQRIERWWRSGRQGGFQYWIEFFSGMEADGLLTTSDQLHIECMRFCFWDLLQEDLKKIKIDWNQHSIRHSSGADCPGGKPDLLYHMPQWFGTHNYKMAIRLKDVDEMEASFAVPECDMKGCSANFQNMFHSWEMQRPQTALEAKTLFSRIVRLLGNV